jgi:hypothetical protein
MLTQNCRGTIVRVAISYKPAKLTDNNLGSHIQQIENKII